MKIKEIPYENRPRERMFLHGASVLSDAELLAVILQKGARGENVSTSFIYKLNIY